MQEELCKKTYKRFRKNISKEGSYEKYQSYFEKHHEELLNLYFNDCVDKIANKKPVKKKKSLSPKKKGWK